MYNHHRPLTPLDPRDFEPRSTTPVNARLSPEKVPICTGFTPFGGGDPRSSIASSSNHGVSPKSRKSGKGLLGVEGLLGNSRERQPFTPVRMTRRRAESVSPVLLGGGSGVPEQSFAALAQPPAENQFPVGRPQRGLGSLQLPPTYASEAPARPQSMALSSNGLPLPASNAPRFRPSTSRVATVPDTAPTMLSPLAREVSPFPSPRIAQTPIPSSPLVPSSLRSPQPGSSSPLASPSTPKIRAKLTPMASPRRKPLLPGAPNPETHVHDGPRRSESPTKGLLQGMGHRLRAVASVPALRSRANQADGWINANSSAAGAGLGIHAAPPPLPVSAWSAAPAFEPLPSAAPTNVLVCIRVRPANHSTSKALAATSAAEDIGGRDAWIVDEYGGSLAEDGGVLNPSSDDWRFDAVRSGSENSSVYDVAAKDLVLSCMHGYDTSIFAYGQTASGKTFTLTGSPSNPGIIPLSIRDVFSFIRSHPSRDFLLRASYLELYNETLKDLLADGDEGGAGVKVRQDPATGNFFPAGVREEVVSCEAHVEALLQRGELRRRVAGTEYNARSSRSHTVFVVTVESRDAGDVEGHGVVRTSRLSLIDLAGSERAVSQAERRAEGAFINKSLLTLEKVISALADSATAAPTTAKIHVPYRDSKLTQLLQPSLSGSARVAVVCTINPSSWAVEESRSTLRFAKRCKKVTVRAQVNEVVSERALITRYRMQIAELQAQLATAAAMTPTTAETFQVPSTPSTPRQASTSSNTSDDLKLREKRRRERDAAEADRKELRERLEKLQSIVLNASNVDKEKSKITRQASLGPSPVSPSKGFRTGEGPEDDDDDSDDTGRVSSPNALSREIQLENEVASLRRQVGVLEDELAQRPSLPASATPDEVDVRIAELEQEVRELKVVVANGEAEAVREECERTWLAEVQTARQEVQRRKEFEQDLRRELEEARNRCKKLELYIIDELSHSASNLARPRRSSLGSTLGYTVATHRRRRMSLDDVDENGVASPRPYDEFGVGRQRPEDALELLMAESPDLTCVRASFAGLDLDVGPEMEAVRKDWRRRTEVR